MHSDFESWLSVLRHLCQVGSHRGCVPDERLSEITTITDFCSMILPLPILKLK